MSKIYKAIDKSYNFQVQLYNILDGIVDEDECVDTLLQNSLVDIAEAIESNRHRKSMFEGLDNLI